MLPGGTTNERQTMEDRATQPLGCWKAEFRNWKLWPFQRSKQVVSKDRQEILEKQFWGNQDPEAGVCASWPSAGWSFGRILEGLPRRKEICAEMGDTLCNLALYIYISMLSYYTVVLYYSVIQRDGWPAPPGSNAWRPVLLLSCVSLCRGWY